MMKSRLYMFACFVVFANVVVICGSTTNSDSGSAKDGNGNTAPGPLGPLASNGTVANCSNGSNNTAGCGAASSKSLMQKFYENQGMLMRTFYVLIGVTLIVIMYFVVRAVRLRRNKNKSKKYGVISTEEDNLEMTPLDADDDDEDMTVFEVNGHHTIQRK